MKTYEIEVQQTIITTVSVPAESEEAALEAVDQRDFPLPDRNEWSSLKGSFEYEVLNEDDGEGAEHYSPADLEFDSFGPGESEG